MMERAGSPAGKISALVSDVDGTLVTDDKILTERAQAAVVELHARGIKFTIVSSRPPRGLRMLLKPLNITAPIGGFNGAVIAAPDLSVITQHLLQPEVTRQTIDMLGARGVQAWVFAGSDWLISHPDGPHVEHETHTIGFLPTIVENFEPYVGIAAKIVGVSTDYDLLARCEREVSTALSGQATVARSQPYYLDVTHPLANKGDAFSEFSKLLGVPPAEIAVIGDGANDVAMFERAGLSIAMGNAGPEVQRSANVVTGSNRDEGFAHAVERYILGGDCPAAPGHKVMGSATP
ncbi:MAG TPA: Cof-type HAD-IIB family hydrolase [Pseudolabrys sp.]|jgi:hypothetical protein|nr:Cof-type HAD-IIB family hydrolase [Pseudolabrys sp.]